MRWRERLEKLFVATGSIQIDLKSDIALDLTGSLEFCSSFSICSLSLSSQLHHPSVRVCEGDRVRKERYSCACAHLYVSVCVFIIWFMSVCGQTHAIQILTIWASNYSMLVSLCVTFQELLLFEVQSLSCQAQPWVSPPSLSLSTSPQMKLFGALV